MGFPRFSEGASRTLPDVSVEDGSGGDRPAGGKRDRARGARENRKRGAGNSRRADRGRGRAPLDCAAAREPESGGSGRTDGCDLDALEPACHGPRTDAGARGSGQDFRDAQSRELLAVRVCDCERRGGDGASERHRIVSRGDRRTGALLARPRFGIARLEGRECFDGCRGPAGAVVASGAFVYRRCGACDVADWRCGNQSCDPGRGGRRQYAGLDPFTKNSVGERAATCAAAQGVSDSSHAADAGGDPEQRRSQGSWQPETSDNPVVAEAAVAVAHAATNTSPGARSWLPSRACQNSRHARCKIGSDRTTGEWAGGRPGYSSARCAEEPANNAGSPGPTTFWRQRICEAWEVAGGRGLSRRS